MRINPVPNEGTSIPEPPTFLHGAVARGFRNAYLKATNTGVDDLFGSSVAMSGDLIVTGAPDEDGAGIGVNPLDTGFAPGSGATYIFGGIGPLRDQDGDGVADIFETYFGTSLTTPGGPPWTVALSAGQLRLRWPEVKPLASPSRPRVSVSRGVPQW